MQSYRITCEDGYRAYIRAKGLEGLSVTAVCDADGTQHEVDDVRECSDAELRKAWIALERGEA